MTDPTDNRPKPLPPTNYRANRRRQERTLLFLVVFVLVVIGSGLIGLIWGVQSAILGGLCLAGGAALITGLWLLLSLLQKFVDE
ncbi:MAG: hypothetical protein FOGNACKC_01016 [Anaerolineae bacterium]|nr:hypothetical protein [Anaerolineae bacterium]